MLSTTLVSLRRLLGGLGQAAESGFQLTRPAARPRVRGAEMIFRLKAWPELSDGVRTAEVYRVLSVMSSQPVSRQWLQDHCTMPTQELDKLLRLLVAQGDLEVIDPARFVGREPLQA